MRVAIYARYSTDQQDNTSIAGQVANCEALAARNDWTITEHYGDEAISGSDDSRPAYVQLLADSEAALFDAIIVDETSRLTRRPGELPRILDILAFRDQFLVDCKGFDSRHETAALLASVYGGIDSLELNKIKERTHRGLRERAKAGYSAGGKTYGYSTEPIEPDDPQSKKRHVVVESEAIIVHEIFTRFANGESPRKICDDLNARSIPSPGSSWNRTAHRSRGWMGSALSGTAAQYTGILRREIYIGQVIWNRRKSKKVPGTSRRVYDIRPESEWIIREQPELRIINDALWDRVQSRLKSARKSTHEKNKRARGRPSRYLLSGLLKCGCCGANFIMRDTRAYACSSNTNGGRHLCDNGIRVNREIAEKAILNSVKTRLLSDDAIQYVVGQFEKALREMERKPDDSVLLKNKLRTIEAKLSKLTNAIETVGVSDTLAKRLRILEQEKAETEQALERVPAEVKFVPDVIPALVERWREMALSLESLPDNPHVTQQEIQTARANLAALLGNVTLNPRNGILWAHPAPNAKGLTEVRPLDGLRINSPFCGSGGTL
jgi:DNA invertase Pin-like site-specific DNA recombinase